MVSHAILGAALAYVNNGNPAAGGSAAVASEAAAGYLAERYNDGKTAINPKTGQFDPNLLSEDAKTLIRDLTAAIGAVVGGIVGDSAFNAQLAGVVGQNAVENNIDSPADRKDAKANANQLYKSACASAGLAAGSAACGQYLRNETAVLIKQAGSLTLDFIPIIGDIKGFAEAESVGDYIFATAGLIPIVGDAAKEYDKAQKLFNEASKVGDVAKMKAAMNDAVQACSGGACFTAGTLIKTDQGLKAVEEFVGGELVWARNDLTLEYGYRPVIATKVTAEQAIFEVVIQNEVGQQEILETTAEHSFWIKGLGWLKASLLQSGMTLLDRNNDELTIVSQMLIADRLETVYNIEVKGFHTYHVGKLGVWVHNANCCDVRKIEETLPKVKSWEIARNNAINQLGDLGMDAKPVVGRLEVSAGYNQVIGRQTSDAKRGWRVDFDPEKGPHINIWDYSKGKGPDKAIKRVIPFEGNENTFKTLLKQLNR
nr:polymorphic toxin-type HINT domain-containing protein [Acinetobacter baylyi]